MSAVPSEDDPGPCGFSGTTGQRCVESLGHEGGHELGYGFDGRAYALNDPDGRVLKLSRHPMEAALAALLLRERLAGRPIEGFPDIHAVDRLEVEGFGPLWAILRESVESPYPDPTPSEAIARDRLGAAIARFAIDWAAGRAAIPGDAADADGYGLDGLARGLQSLRDRHGLTLSELGPPAFGATRSGRLVIRDFGRVSGSAATIGPLLDGLPPPVGVPMPRDGLSP